MSSLAALTMQADDPAAGVDDAPPRTSAMPKSLELVLTTNESITIELDPLPAADELEVVIDMFVEEKPPAHFWTALASRCWNAGRREEAELVVSRGCSIMPVHRPNDCAPLFALHASFLLAEARTAPKQVLDDARFQPLGERSTKQQYFRQVHDIFQRAQSVHAHDELLTQARAITALMTGDTPLASKLFDGLLLRANSSPVALMGRACVQLRTRQFLAALQTYQQALRITIRMDQWANKHGDASHAWHGPDPRIGIGLCLWSLGRYDAARRAWRRAAAYRADASPPHLLLGLSLINAAKYPGALPAGMYGAHTQRPEDEARRAAYADGLMHVQQAWQRDKTCAMSAVVLAAHLSTQALHAMAPLFPSPYDMSTSRAPMPSTSSDTLLSILGRALKLGEHAVQYADARSIVVHAWLQYAQALHLAAQLPEHASDHTVQLTAQRYYARVLEAQARALPTDAGVQRLSLAHGTGLATLGLAQIQASTGDMHGAVRTLDDVLARPGGAEAYATDLALMAGLILASAHDDTSENAHADQRRARALLDRVVHTAVEAHSLLSSHAGDGGVLASERLSTLTLGSIAHMADDPRVRSRLSLLWARTSRERAVEHYEAALELVKKRGESDWLAYALELNVGALLSFDTHDAATLRTALSHLQRALVAPGEDEPTQAVKVMANFNIGRAFETLGDEAQARDAYMALLAAHPEYVAARVRVAVLDAHVPQEMQVSDGETSRSARDVANARFKEALSSDPSDLSVRAEYMRFLAGAYPANRHAAWPALKDSAAQLFLGAEAGKAVFGSASVARRVAEEARHDSYILGTLGWAYYQLGIHAQPGPNQRAERTKCMLRAADLYDKALGANSQNVFAAQGLAILVAEDALGDPNVAPDVLESRRKAAAEDAAALLGKLREVRDDASVYICQGHAFMLCGAFDRAVHVYELALHRYNCDRDPAVLQYSARALFAQGMHEHAISLIEVAMTQLRTACEVLAERCKAAGVSDVAHASTSAALEWKQVQYNRAVMSHKALQMLYDTSMEQRTSSELRMAIEWVRDAQPLLEGPLVDAAEQNQLSYITNEIVEQRAKYAEMSLLKQADQQLHDALAYEEAQREKLAQLDEKQREREARLAQLRREKEEEHRRRAEAIAESRRRAREEANQIEYDREPSPEPRKPRASAPRKKKAQEDTFVARDDEQLFEESSDEDNAFAGDDSSESDSENDLQGAGEDEDAERDDAGNASTHVPHSEPMHEDDSDDGAAAPVNPMRARLEALARERKQRSHEGAPRPKKRHGDKAARREAKKAKVDAESRSTA